MLLSLQALEVAYRRGQRDLRVLTNVSLNLAAGEVVAVFATGAQGKSTLLRVAAGMQEPDQGQVLIEGKDIWRLSDRNRQRTLSERVRWVRSSAPDLDISVYERLMTPLRIGRERPSQASVTAMETLEHLGISECAGQHWNELSDWERALVAVAIGIVRRPALLVVDDVTWPLGLVETDDLMQLLHSLAKERGMGVLLGVSDAHAAQWCDRLGTLAGGELTIPSDSQDESEAEHQAVRLRDNRRRTGS